MTGPLIRRVDPHLIRLPLERPIVGPFGRLDARPNLLVIVETEDGGTGLGEVWANFPPWGCEDRIQILRHVLAPALIGEPLDHPSRLYRLMHDRVRLLANQWGAPGPAHQAVAGIDIALWDAHARRAGQPLARMLRRDAPMAVPVYGSGIPAGIVGSTIEEARTAGHCRFKVRTSFGVEKDRATLGEGREAAGSDPLMADANQTFDRSRLADLADAIEAARLDWMEEPFPIDDEAAYAGWPLATPLAFGENAQGEAGLDRVIALGARVVQPDITKTLGITGGLAVGRTVIAAGRRLCFHMFGGCVGLYASAHLTAAIAGGDWVEMDANPNPLLTDTVTPRPVVTAGELALPQGPGLGLSLIR